MEIIKILKKDPPVVVGEREEDTGREGTEVVAKKTHTHTHTHTHR